jgi:hypothetical protein
MAWEVWRYFSNGWIDGYFIAPEFQFTYYGFGWVKPWVLGLARILRIRTRRCVLASHSPSAPRQRSVIPLDALTDLTRSVRAASTG